MRRLAHHDEDDGRTGVRRLVDPAGFAGVGMTLDRVALGGGERHEVAAEPAERMLYVIRGAGTARVDGAEHDLGPESVVWLAPGDGCRLVGGPSGLSVLALRAPAT